MNPASSPPKRRRSYQKSGLYTLKRAVLVLGSRALPAGNTTLGRALRAWRESLIADLGGPDAVSTQQLAIVEKAVTQKLICDSLDAYVFSLGGGLVNKRHRALWPIVRERAGQVNLLRDLLRDLGLERRVKPFDLAAQFAALHRAGSPPPAEAKAEPQVPPASGTDATQARSAGDGGGSEPDPTVVLTQVPPDGGTSPTRGEGGSFIPSKSPATVQPLSEPPLPDKQDSS